jgi:hypothetical protein
VAIEVVQSLEAIDIQFHQGARRTVRGQPDCLPHRVVKTALVEGFGLDVMVD